MTEEGGRVPKLNGDVPWMLVANFLGDRAGFAGLAIYDRAGERTRFTGFLFDRRIGRFTLPRFVRDETSDIELGADNLGE